MGHLIYLDGIDGAGKTTVLQSLRNQGLLDLPRDAQFLLQALAFPLLFDQPRIVQNAGAFHRNREI